MKTTSVADSQTRNIYPKVLVVGMSRTGTSSIKQALEILYEAPVYHMSVVLNNPDHLAYWSDLAFGATAPSEADIRDLMEGYIATTDMPSAYYFELLLAAFPDAKVVLSVRDEGAWVDSYCRLIRAGQRFRFIKFLPPLNRLWPFGEQMHQLIFGKNVVDAHGVVDRASLLAGYREHNQRVVNAISREKLLTFEVTQGWKPLCDFLGKEVPASPFPRLNAGTGGPTKIIASAVSRLSTPAVICVIVAIAFVLVLLR